MRIVQLMNRSFIAISLFWNIIVVYLVLFQWRPESVPFETAHTIAFCLNKDCYGHTGTISCEPGTCPVDGIAFCTWKTNWTCVANLPAGIELINPKVQCLRYQNVIRPTACRLSYETQPGDPSWIWHYQYRDILSLFMLEPVVVLLYVFRN